MHGGAGSAASVDLERLRQDLIERRLASGIDYLNANRAAIETLDPAAEHSGLLSGLLAQWIDAGFESPAMLQCIVARFPPNAQLSLPVIDYLHIRMAIGLLAFSEEEFEQAMRHFQFVRSLDGEVRDRELISIAHFWIGRCLRQEGRYDDALTYTVRAREIALEAGHEKVAAVIAVLESWLFFQKGKLGESERILRHAESVLRETGDHISLGNIQSTHGRIARREGKYERALKHFESAIAHYQRQHTRHRNLARSLVNIAAVKRLIAVQLQTKSDRDAAQRKAAIRRDGAVESHQERSRIGRLRAEAFAELEQALGIYSACNHHRGMGSVYITRGQLHLDGGELDRAENEAREAFMLAEEKRDYILMARARILQCMAENAKFEEQIEDAGEPNRHAQLADELASDAVAFARHTQNGRLLARAYVWQGMTRANDFFDDPEGARACCNSALALLKPEGREHVWEDLRELQAKVLGKGGIDTSLLEWSQGLVGDRSFQQLEEEFAALVIPKVWEREGRKVSRVAAKLAISPKKVRRILQASGMLEKDELGLPD